ncbi:PREDICTED: uncharacterized protein LOC109179963 [Ipomoea nil]|uniref:uncharacterized protein LOC109179963 n=1 Tax=Ipomoea nil TaxID=35883 RepID=UPI000901B85B|nr:PREDICTED: uncharacterized protein LOC109179963 [Ipomoea nil]
MHNNEVSISNTWNATKIVVDANCQEISDFQKRLEVHSTPKLSLNTPSRISSATLEDEINGDTLKTCTIEQLYDFSEVGSYWVLATILPIQTIGDWWYLSCKRCPIKLEQASNCFYCDKFDNSYPDGNFWYKLIIRVVDSTGNAPFLLWDRECNELC